MDDVYLNVEEIGQHLGWRGHSAYFNTQQGSFPKPLNVNGEMKYSLEEVIEWDKNRPLHVSDNIQTGALPIIMKNNIIL